jgi:hypothetical protein
MAKTVVPVVPWSIAIMRFLMEAHHIAKEREGHKLDNSRLAFNGLRGHYRPAWRQAHRAGEREMEGQ